MKKVLILVCLSVFASSLVSFSGCGKSDKDKLVDQIKMMNEFVKTPDYEKIRKDTSAMGLKAEEFAVKAGFKDYMACIKAKQKYMSDPVIMKLDKEQIELDAKYDAKK